MGGVGSGLHENLFLLYRCDVYTKKFAAINIKKITECLEPQLFYNCCPSFVRTDLTFSWEIFAICVKKRVNVLE
jgi:hypothetical protein